MVEEGRGREGGGGGEDVVFGDVVKFVAVERAVLVDDGFAVAFVSGVEN